MKDFGAVSHAQLQHFVFTSKIQISVINCQVKLSKWNGKRQRHSLRTHSNNLSNSHLKSLCNSKDSRMITMHSTTKAAATGSSLQCSSEPSSHRAWAQHWSACHAENKDIYLLPDDSITAAWENLLKPDWRIVLQLFVNVNVFWVVSSSVLVFVFVFFL